ncbi:MAG: hypothetical protein ACRDKB_10645 [Actinomycetota bacterium]
MARSARTLGAAVLVSVVAAGFAAPAPAAPGSPGFGPMIEVPSGYEGQSRCMPKARRGVVAFRRMVMNAYPGTGDFGITRSCSIGGQSEHKEGRAWDWAVDASSTRDRAAVSDLFQWIFAEDRYGNSSARARRLGIMYLIWNRRIWFPYSGWQTYCVQRKRGCVSPSDKGLRHPHTDHVHFSFTWDGAKKRTTFWKASRALVSDVASSRLGGYVLAGANGGIRLAGTGYHGDLSDGFIRSPIAAAAVRPQGDGYWLAARSGKVYAFGAAPELRGARKAEAAIADIEPTSSGKGYWVVSRAGEVFARGDAGDFGSDSSRARIVDLVSSGSGEGYLLLTQGGAVRAFGDAVDLGDVKKYGERAIGIAAPPGVAGYWILTASGRVRAFGDAPALGGPKGWADARSWASRRPRAWAIGSRRIGAGSPPSATPPPNKPSPSAF